MNFRTEVVPKDLEIKISHSSEVLSLGSCFSVNIGNKLDQYGFQISNNPLGTVFNPISLFNIIDTISQEKTLNDSLFVNQMDLWMHHDLHSQFATKSKNDFYTNFENLTTQVNRNLKNASHVIITLGSSFVYEHIESKEIVSNCHKVPQSHFNKRLLSVDEITDSFDKVSNLFKNKQIIFTLSPVRHTKEGLEENSLSKATLKLAINQICNSTTNAHYFPTYEIFMDDLRDYRFYNEDLIHPNKAGIEYVWEKFEKIAFDESTQALGDKTKSIKQAIKHRPFNTQSEEYLKFLKGTLVKAQELNKQVNLMPEIGELQSRIDEFRNS